MIRIQIHIDPKLRPVLNLFAEARLWFTTFGLSPLAPDMARAVIARAELRRPTPSSTRRLP